MAQTSFKGYAIKDIKKWKDFEVIDFEPKRMEEYVSRQLSCVELALILRTGR